jgi:hypothetical protein
LTLAFFLSLPGNSRCRFGPEASTDRLLFT